MGYWKDVIERLGGGNPAAYEDDHVCAQCLGDPGLQDFIEGEVQAKTARSATSSLMSLSLPRL